MKVTIEDGLTGLEVEFVDLGEGRDGEYNPNDPEDVPLLRFDVRVSEYAAEKYEVYGESSFNDDDWFIPDACSYCTGIPVDTPLEVQAELASQMAAVLWRTMLEDGSLKRASQELSWSTEAGIDSPFPKESTDLREHLFTGPHHLGETGQRYTGGVELDTFGTLEEVHELDHTQHIGGGGEFHTHGER